MVGKIEGRRRGGATQDEMVGWHHELNGHEFEQAPGDSEGQESLVCYSPRGHKQLDMTEQLNSNNILGKGRNLILGPKAVMWLFILEIT